MPYWARNRDDDWYSDMVLHNNWIMEDIQLGYISFEEEEKSVFALKARRRKGYWGASGWYLIDVFVTLEELCAGLTKVMNEHDVIGLHRSMDKFDERKAEEKRRELMAKYCGSDPEKRISRI